MPIIRTANIDAIGIGEAFGVSISCRHDGDGGLTLANGLAAELNITRGQTSGVLAGSLVPQQFFNRGRYQREVALYLPHHLWIVQQSEEAIADQVGGGLLAADHGDNAVGDYFFRAQAVAVDLRGQ